MVGACNKNGNYYAARQSDLSLVWSFHVGARSSAIENEQCDAAAIFDGSHLFISGDSTTIGGVSYGGSIREMNPATGTPIWQTGLPASILGSSTLDGSGVIAAASYDYSGPVNSGYLIRASNRAVARNDQHAEERRVPATHLCRQPAAVRHLAQRTFRLPTRALTGLIGSLCWPHSVSCGFRQDVGMTAYWISVYNEIVDPAKVAAYAKLARPALEAAGGSFIAAGVPEQAYEAGQLTRTVIIEFASVEAARDAHDSAAYQQALAALDGGAVRDLRIVAGLT